MINQPETTETALYIINQMKPEIENGSFRSIVRHAEQLYLLIRFAAIAEERHDAEFPFPPIMRIPDRRHGET